VGRSSFYRIAEENEFGINSIKAIEHYEKFLNLSNTRVSVFTEGEAYCVYFVDSLPYLCILAAIEIRLSIYIMLITNFADCGALFQKAFSLMKLATDPSRLASLPA
jgi:hypothetical protein